MRTGEGVWPRVMKKEEGSLVRALCNCQEQERERSREALRRRERENGEKEGTCGSSNGIKLGPT